MSVVLGLVLACAQPQPNPKTGDVVHDCAPAGGPKVEAPQKGEPAPAPEAPAVESKRDAAPKREQPCPQGDRPVSPDKQIASEPTKPAPSA
ncbi:MAG: hypothetical protein QM831_46015 [Kofleriaceae bacterium]